MLTNIKRCQLFFLVLALALLAVGCKKEEKYPSRVNLRLKWVFDPGFAGEMVAAKKGFFSKRGLNVELKPGGFEADPIKLVASGSDMFGVAGADQFLLARAKGVPIVAFAAGYIDTPVVYYSRKSSGINSPKDFVGKKVGYQAGQDTATIYEALLRKLGIDRDKIKEVPVRFDFSPFLTGQVDVWPGYAATQSYILEQKGIPYNVIKPRDYGIKYIGTVYFATEQTINKYPDVVQTFLDSLIEGWEFTYSNINEAIPLIASYDEKNLMLELIKFNLDKQKEYIIPKGSHYCQFEMKSWSEMQKILLDQGLLDKPVNLKDAITFKFLGNHYSSK